MKADEAEEGGGNNLRGGWIGVSGEEALKSRLLRGSGRFDAGNPVRGIAVATVELEGKALSLFPKLGWSSS
jgi:hypothetical protein